MWFLTFCIFFSSLSCSQSPSPPPLYSLSLTHTHAQWAYTGLPLLIAICKTSPHHFHFSSVSPALLLFLTARISSSPTFPPWTHPSISPFSPLYLHLHLGPAWCVVVRGGVSPWHWVCSARRPTAAGGPLGSSGVGVCWLWSGECVSPANTLIQNTNLEITSEGMYGGGMCVCMQGAGLTFSLSLSPPPLLLLSFPPSLCLSACIKYTDSG